MSDQIVTIRPEKTIMTKRLLPNFVGISQESAGSTGLAMNIVIIPPGAAAAPHYHDGFETAIYILEGSVRTLYGPGLKRGDDQPRRRVHVYSGQCAPPADQHERD